MEKSVIHSKGRQSNRLQDTFKHSFIHRLIIKQKPFKLKLQIITQTASEGGAFTCSWWGEVQLFIFIMHSYPSTVIWMKFIV